MLQKKLFSIHKYTYFTTFFFITEKLKIKNQKTKHKIHLIASNLFFKKIAYIGLAINNIYLKKFYLTTIKSIMYSIWDTVATYTFIF